MSASRARPPSTAARSQPSAPPADRPALRAVPAPARRGGRAFPVLVIVTLAAGLIGLLLVNLAMQRSAFELSALSAQGDDLRVRQQELDLTVARLASPEHLTQAAQAQGMVPNPNPVFLHLGSGKVIGTPTPARAGSGSANFVPVPEPTRAPPPSPSQPSSGHRSQR